MRLKNRLPLPYVALVFVCFAVYRREIFHLFFLQNWFMIFHGLLRALSQSGGSLWDGDFDEEANAKAFQAARDAWKRGVPLDETKPEVAFSAASATAASHFAPSVAAASDVHAPSKPVVKSLWDGEFDEEANANAFKAARDAWKKGVDLVDEFSEKRAPAPAAASGKSASVAQPKFAASESLLHGSFDELGNRRAFQEARIAWLESQKREAKKDAGSGNSIIFFTAVFAI